MKPAEDPWDEELAGYEPDDLERCLEMLRQLRLFVDTQEAQLLGRSGSEVEPRSDSTSQGNGV